MEKEKIIYIVEYFDGKLFMRDFKIKWSDFIKEGLQKLIDASRTDGSILKVYELRKGKPSCLCCIKSGQLFTY